MPRGLDHIVHAVRDLDAAAELYRRLGFTVGARNRHPWGTHNHIVQLPGFFIELLTLAEPDKLGSDGFSVLFGAYQPRFPRARRGLVDAGAGRHDARADAAAFRAAGIGDSEVMQFEREGKRPDGTAVKVGFSLAFAEDRSRPTSASAPASSIFRRTSGIRHSSSMPTASRVSPASCGGEESGAASRLPAGLYRRPKRARHRRRLRDRLPRGAIELTTPAAFERRFGLPAPDASARRATGGPALFGPGARRGAAGCHGRRAGIRAIPLTGGFPVSWSRRTRTRSLGSDP